MRSRGRGARGRFPPPKSPRSRRWRASCRRSRAGRCRATPTSPKKPGGCSTSTGAAGRAGCCPLRLRDLGRREEPAAGAGRPPRPRRPGPRPSRARRVRVRAAWHARLPRSARRPRPRRGLFGRCEPKTGIEPFGRLVEQVMTTEPYASAQRVFWIVENGSSHAGQRSIDRLPVWFVATRSRRRCHSRW